MKKSWVNCPLLIENCWAGTVLNQYQLWMNLLIGRVCLLYFFIPCIFILIFFHFQSLYHLFIFFIFILMNVYFLQLRYDFLNSFLFFEMSCLNQNYCFLSYQYLNFLIFQLFNNTIWEFNQVSNCSNYPLNSPLNSIYLNLFYQI